MARFEGNSTYKPDGSHFTSRLLTIAFELPDRVNDGLLDGITEEEVPLPKQVIEIPKDHPTFAARMEGYETYGYSPAVRAGGLLFIAGEVGFAPDGSIPTSIAEQTELALTRTKEILKIAGLTMADLVEVVSYHVDLAANIGEFLPIKEKHTARPFPAWSIIGVQALGLPELKIEIRSVAAFPEGR